MIIRCWLSAVLLLLSVSAKAQYTLMGKITYERKVNLYKLWEGDEWMERFKDKAPQFMSNYFELSFTPASAWYKPGKETEAPKMSWGLPPGAENEVYTDFTSRQVFANKQIYEEKFLIQDSMQQLQWRITNEIRTIADFKCRKAVTKICDSVYVIAFYTDDIPVSGGPEQFGGLPGMILQLAIPRLHTTWVASQVSVVTITNPETPPAAKGKKVNRTELTATIRKGLKDWGKNAAKNIWWTSL